MTRLVDLPPRQRLLCLSVHPVTVRRRSWVVRVFRALWGM